MVGHMAVMQTEVNFITPDHRSTMRASTNTPMIKKKIDPKSPIRKTHSGLSDMSNSTVTTLADSDEGGVVADALETTEEGRRCEEPCMVPW